MCPLLTHNRRPPLESSSFFFFNDTATTEIYTLSLHDALPIWTTKASQASAQWSADGGVPRPPARRISARRSEEHTSELQSPCNLVCRLLLEKKKKTQKRTPTNIDRYSAS